MGMYTSLNREQKEALGLLQIGTFLEYFDLMLYVHMGVLLNDIFFPKTDPHTASLLASFAFCSTFIVRPVGAFIFGWLGDNIGRKSTIILTTLVMSISCILMANLPTYTQIGIAATWVMILCRMAQGISSMGEIVGAHIYIAETIRRPASYAAVTFITITAGLGEMVALGVATLVISYSMNWRLAFWMGAIIAIVGTVARTRLRETPDFLEMKRQQIKEGLAHANEDLKEDERQDDPEIQSGLSALKISAWKDRVQTKTLLSYFFICCGWPVTFYLIYFYFNPLLKDFGYLPVDIIKHNFLLCAFCLVTLIVLGMLSYRIHPIKILKIRAPYVIALMIVLPFLVNSLRSPSHVFLLQCIIILLAIHSVPAESIFIYHLPIYPRFTLATFLFALSRAVAYFLSSFGLVYLGNYFGAYGLWFITLPLSLCYLYGVLHFEDLEQRSGHLSLSPRFKWFSKEKAIVEAETP